MSRIFRFREREWRLAEGPYILGIMNVTPDSFSDGSNQNADPGYQVEKAHELLEHGADALDLGAESTRPGHTPISAHEEWGRLAPVLTRVRKAQPSVPISVDTYKAEVAERALDEGADIINDIWGLSAPSGVGPCVATAQAGLILMYNEVSTPDGPVSLAMRKFFERALNSAHNLGIGDDHILVDPGVGFRLTGPPVWEVLAHLDSFSDFGAGVLVGHSRKRFLGASTGVTEPQKRDLATAVLSALLRLSGVDVLRVHDPGATRQAIQIANQWRTAGGTH